METMDIAVLQNKLTTSPPSKEELEKMATETAKNILLKINECSVSITEAKGEADKANKLKIRIFDIGSKKKINATSESLVQTNKAIAEMNNVVQEAIKFTCVSYAFAEQMRNMLQIMIANGFKDTNGRLVQLNENGREAAELVLQETESFAQRQKEQESKLLYLKESIDENKEKIDEQDKKLSVHEELFEHARKSRQRMHIKHDEYDKLHEQAKQSFEEISLRVETLEKISNRKLLIVIFILAFFGFVMGGISLFLQLF